MDVTPQSYHPQVIAHPTTTDNVLDGKTISSLTAALKSVFAWRMVRGDDRLKVFKCVMALTPELCRVALANPDHQRALFCEAFVYIMRPKAMRLPENTFFALFTFNGERRYCAVTPIYRIPHPQTEDVCTLEFLRLKPTAAPPDMPDPTAETIPTHPVISALAEAYAVPATPPDTASNCCLLSPGAWWHYPTAQIYCWALDEELLPLCPPGYQSRTLGRLLANISGHPSSCRDCATPHVDSANSLWSAPAIAEACPCNAPCSWVKLATQALEIEGDASLCQLLFRSPVNKIMLLDSYQTPRITDRLDNVVLGEFQTHHVPLAAQNWKLYVLSSYVSRMFLTSCPNLVCIISHLSSLIPTRPQINFR
ncbi:tegument protein [Macropodid alphaherpesvirus 1]|uniref:Tegument protein n=1 Tax=Macropodid alphaherpesvirus 1 TaxID=137443 RepID=A0A120HUI7_9ALPH|nr:tegument protein [Macropodid alphaherpesvirus 1]AMB17032.1 tegument protein [Macropodid alphaherpesvirus 1]